MTGTCTIDGCHQIIAGPECNNPAISQADADFAEFVQFREIYLRHVLQYHQELFGTLNAHAADYASTVLTKFVTSSSPDRMDAARHDLSRLFYWVLMGDLMAQRPARTPAGIPGAPAPC